MVNAGHSEQGTICHFCFTSASWVVIRERTPPVKLPSDWVYDHPARDIAEWIRYQLNDFEARDKQKSILQFINSYEERFSLTSFTRNMMFGRLLFPYHYVEQVEQIYLREAPKENGRLNECLQTIWDNEGEQMKQMSYLLKNVVSNNESHEPAWIWTCTE